VIDWLTSVVQFAALGVAAWFLVLTLRKRPVIRWHLYLLAALEVIVLAQAITSIVQVTGVSFSDETIMFVGYLATAALVVPAAGIWGTIDRSHWGTAVVAGGCATVAVLVLRMDQVWRLVGAAT